MYPAGFDPIILLLAASGAASIVAVAILSFKPRLQPVMPHMHLDAGGEAGEIVFLFDGARLMDASEAGDRFLEAAPQSDSAWSRLMSLLAASFDDLPGDFEAFVKRGATRYLSRDGSAELSCELHGGLLRLTISDPPPLPTDFDGHRIAAMQRELEVLRANTESAPCLLWRKDSQGRTTWCNRKYFDLLRNRCGSLATGTWPLPELFQVGKTDAGQAAVRTALEVDGAAKWFEIQQVPCMDEFLLCATPIDATIHAERQLNEFRQVLTRTFAEIAIGLAVFDRGRRLVLFNPALSQLTGLPAAFLANRPTLRAVLDRLRDLGRLPEPKDYAAWRERLAAIEADALEGHYSEKWTLGSGQTLHVRGRPHTDGAIAFILEDITDEVARTRRLRSEMAIGQAVIDQIDEAIAVFSDSGVLTMSNQAYCELWRVDPMARLTRVTISDEANIWRAAAPPTALWSEVRSFAASGGTRVGWIRESRLKDGRALRCRVAPLTSGATLVGFRVFPERPQLQRLA